MIEYRNFIIYSTDSIRNKFMCGSDKIYISVQCIEVDNFIDENEFKV